MSPDLTPDAPTILVVFGATGDLMERKIAPALFHLSEKGRLPERFRVVGFARRPFPDEVFRHDVAAMVRAAAETPPDPPALDAFARRFCYRQGHFDEDDAYARLAEDLKAMDSEWETCSNKLFYLAVPPQFYQGIFERLAGSGLTVACGGGLGWTRVLVEKPFGKDAQTARDLDELLGSLFREEQIYRIDHYLAKEMLQGIINFRFSNNLLEPSWSRRAIERIDVTLLETLGAEDRGAFYDGVGALRDVGQNHLLQMLALVTMDQPESDSADAIRSKRAAVLRALKPLTPGEVREATFRAQYDGYRSIEGVAPDSTTETYFKLRAFLGAHRWEGVPLTLQAGKRLGHVRKEIVVSFRHPRPCLCEPGHHFDNKVVFTLEPDESIRIRFFTKKPGLDRAMAERDFNFFLYEREEKAQYVEEYAKLLLDCVLGDQTLFVSTEEVRAMWAFADPVVCGWRDDLTPLERYVPDTDEVVARAEHVGHVVAPWSGRLVEEAGVVGLGKMGRGIAVHLAELGWRTVGYNRTAAVTKSLEADGVAGAYSLKELVSMLAPPRTVWVMLPAGDVVDTHLFGEGGLAELLESGDTIVDGGNSFYKDAPRRAEKLAERDIRFVDCGTSGGPVGARWGACLMIGGDADDVARLAPLWSAIAVPDGWRHFPGHGAGHFVKMVHNGIEYGMMQALAEGFTILHASPFDLDLTRVAEIYNNGSVIESRLVRWLADAFDRHGEELAGVSGAVAHTGEGEWTVRTAEELGVRDKVIADALEFRVLSETAPDYTSKLLSGMREAFGGHAVTGGSG